MLANIVHTATVTLRQFLTCLLSGSHCCSGEADMNPDKSAHEPGAIFNCIDKSGCVTGSTTDRNYSPSAHSNKASHIQSASVNSAASECYKKKSSGTTSDGYQKISTVHSLSGLSSSKVNSNKCRKRGKTKVRVSLNMDPRSFNPSTGSTVTEPSSTFISNQTFKGTESRSYTENGSRSNVNHHKSSSGSFHTVVETVGKSRVASTRTSSGTWVGFPISELVKLL